MSREEVEAIVKKERDTISRIEEIAQNEPDKKEKLYEMIFLAKKVIEHYQKMAI